MGMLHWMCGKTRQERGLKMTTLESWGSTYSRKK